MTGAITEALAILVRLNEARRIGQLEAAFWVDECLEDFDRARGYSRSRSADYFMPARRQ